MTEEDWTEPTQQAHSATKATPTDADDRAEKAAARWSIKGTSFRINAARLQPTLSITKSTFCNSS